MTDKRLCGRCGAQLTEVGTDRLCPACLLEGGLDAGGSVADQPPWAVPLASRSAQETTVFYSFGDYELLEEIARGGMGIVYRARQVSLNRIVAVKVLISGLLASPEFVQRFRAEAAAAASLQHPNIVAIHEVGFREGQHFFAMDYVLGSSLAELTRNGPLAARRAAGYVKTIAGAIHYAHERGILHRDLKPANVLIDENDQPRVTDFGLAKDLHKQTDLTLSGQVLGSPSYMSPEQAGARRGLVGRRSDVYSLGAILYHLLTARAPFLGDTIAKTLHQVQNDEPVSPRLLNGAVPQDLATICLKCLEKEPEKRYATAEALAEDLGRLLERKPILARPISRPEKFWRWCRRNPVVATLAATVVLVFALGFAGVTWQGQRASKARDIAQHRLYDSLVREARATRMAHRVGYRDEVFALLQQAHALDVPQKDLAELRREAATCLGDFVGLTPTTWTDFPANAEICLMEVEPAGRLAAFGLSDGTILLREMPSGKEVGRLKGGFPTKSLCFSDLGDLLLSVHTPGAASPQEELAGSVVCIWARSADGRWGEAERLALPGTMECLSTAKGVYLALADVPSHTLTLVDARTRAVVHRLEYPKEMSKPSVSAESPGGPPRIALSPDGRFFAVETVEPQEPDISLLDVRDLTTGQLARRLDLRLSKLSGIRFSLDGQYLTAFSETGAAIYAMEGLRRMGEVKEYFREGQSLAFVPGSPAMSLPLFQQNRVRLWDPVRNEDIASFKEPQGAYRTAFTRNGDFLLTCGDEHACLYRLGVAAEKLTLSGHVGGVPGVTFSPDGFHLASVGKDRMLRVWDAGAGRIAWEDGPLPGQGQCVAYSPDGQFLATGDWDTQLIWLWDVRTRKRLLELGTNAPGRTWSAQFTCDGRYLVAGGVGSSPEYGIRVWAMERRALASSEPGLEPRLVKSLEGAVASLLPALDGRYLAFVNNRQSTVDHRGPDTPLCVWDFLSEGPPRRITSDFWWSVQAESFTPDGSKLVVVNASREVTLLDVASGKKVSSFVTLDGPRKGSWVRYFAAVCLSPDGTKLALSSPSNLGMEIWDPGSGRLLYSLPEQDGTVYWVAWSPDSRRLAVSRSNGDIAIWNLPEVERVLTELGLYGKEALANPPAAAESR